MGLKQVNTAPKVAVTDTIEETAIVQNAEITAGAVGPKNRKPSKSVDDLKAQGEAIYEQMDENAKKAIGSKSATVELVRALGGRRLGETKTTVNKEELKGQPKVLGFELKMKEDTKIIRFSDPTKQARTEIVKKGQTVQVTAEEAAYLAAQPEYGGAFANSVLFVRGTAKGYSGSLKLVEGSLRDGKLTEIDVKNEQTGKYDVLPEYAEVFGYLYVVRKSERPGAANGKTVDSAQNLLNTGLGFMNYLKQKKNLG